MTNILSFPNMTTREKIWRKNKSLEWESFPLCHLIVFCFLFLFCLLHTMCNALWNILWSDLIKSEIVCFVVFAMEKWWDNSSHQGLGLRLLPGSLIKDVEIQKHRWCRIGAFLTTMIKDSVALVQRGPSLWNNPFLPQGQGRQISVWGGKTWLSLRQAPQLIPRAVNWVWSSKKMPSRSFQ